MFGYQQRVKSFPFILQTCTLVQRYSSEQVLWGAYKLLETIVLLGFQRRGPERETLAKAVLLCCSEPIRLCCTSPQFRKAK